MNILDKIIIYGFVYVIGILCTYLYRFHKAENDGFADREFKSKIEFLIALIQTLTWPFFWFIVFPIKQLAKFSQWYCGLDDEHKTEEIALQSVDVTIGKDLYDLCESLHNFIFERMAKGKHLVDILYSEFKKLK